MRDYISRKAAKDAIESMNWYKLIDDVYSTIEETIEAVPAADVRPVVLCRDCRHRPFTTEHGKKSGFAVECPDRECKCPCFNDDDGYYSWIPEDEFFCGYGERRGGGTPTE